MSNYNPFDGYDASHAARTDDTPVTPSARDIEAVPKTLLDALQGINMIREYVTQGKPIPKSLVRNALGVAISHCQRAAKDLGVELVTEAEMEETYARLRAANERIRFLERQQGDSVSPDEIKQGFKLFSRKLYHWWSKDGLGHVREVSQTCEGHAKVNLSAMILGRDRGYMYPDTTKTSKELAEEYYQSLTDRGFVFAMADSGREILDCEASRNALYAFIAEALPSARIDKIRSRNSRDGKIPPGETQYAIGDIDLTVYDLDDLKALPDPVCI